MQKNELKTSSQTEKKKIAVVGDWSWQVWRRQNRAAQRGH